VAEYKGSGRYRSPARHTTREAIMLSAQERYARRAV
jgi:hypothetical protein